MNEISQADFQVIIISQVHFELKEGNSGINRLKQKKMESNKRSTNADESGVDAAWEMAVW